MKTVARAVVALSFAIAFAVSSQSAWLSTANAQESAAATALTPASLMPEIPHLEQWRNSPHADITREAFRHWDEEDDKMIPEDCARCHSTSGRLDFLGADGSAAGVVDVKHPTDPANAPGVACMACHNDVARRMTTVTFPSGIEQEVFTSDVRCMNCHGGRASTVQVFEAIEKAGSPSDDMSSADIAFVNIHYRAAAASRFGGEVQAGFEYDGKDYAGFYFHDQDSQTCNDCHSPHTLEVKVAACTECHKEVVAGDEESLRLIRTSKIDFDGNGNTAEGIDAEIKTIHAYLLEAIMGYAKDVVGTAVGHDAHAYPYFFQDTDGSGAIEESEAKFPNRYQSWTPRLLKAAYNYQLVQNDVGIFTHNGYYAMQLMLDSIEDLAQAGSGFESIGTRPE